MYQLWVFHAPNCMWVHILRDAQYEELVKEMMRWDIAEIVFRDRYSDIPF